MRKTLTALAAATTMIVAMAAPNQADAYWRRGYGGWGYGGGIIAGLAAGAIIGGLAANRGYYYGSGGYYGSGYYGPGYAYGPGYYGSGYYGSSFFPGSGPHVGYYGYEQPVYVQPAPRYYRGGYEAQGGCWVETDSTRGYGYYRPC